jgi:hypothetical protein
LRCLSRLGCITSALMKPSFNENGFSKTQDVIKLWPALMLGIFSGEFAKRQQMILFAVFGIPKVEYIILYNGHTKIELAEGGCHGRTS